MEVEARLDELGLVLPEPLQTPPGLVLPFSFVRVRGDRAYVSGHGFGHSTRTAEIDGVLNTSAAAPVDPAGSKQKAASQRESKRTAFVSKCIAPRRIP